MDHEANEFEPEVLSYLAFRNRQLLRAWRERRRVHQAREYPRRSGPVIEEPRALNSAAPHTSEAR